MCRGAYIKILYMCHMQHDTPTTKSYQFQTVTLVQSINASLDTSWTHIILFLECVVKYVSVVRAHIRKI